MSSPNQNTLPFGKAIKEMLAGRAMVDSEGSVYKMRVVGRHADLLGFSRMTCSWCPRSMRLPLTGWRHATPKELAEIERCSR